MFNLDNRGHEINKTRLHNMYICVYDFIFAIYINSANWKNIATLILEPSNIMHLKVLTVFAILCSSALADQFGKYQTEFGKQYTSPKEYVQRKAIFEANLKEIEKHNENRANTYTMGVNQFTDMTQNEFDALIQGRSKGCFADYTYSYGTWQKILKGSCNFT